MKRYEVVLSEAADGDLNDILGLIAELSRSPRTAQRFIDRILSKCCKIGDLPFGGRRRDDLMPGLRTVPFEKSTLIAYHVLDDRVEITNAFYGGRDYEALYRDQGPDS